MEIDMGFFAKLEQGALDILKNAGVLVEAFAMTETQHAVAQAKTTDLGALATSLVTTFSNHNMSGTGKLAAVAGALVPAVEEFVAKGGLPGLEASALDFARELAQSSFNDFVTAATKAV
jgi:hypothetical protein